MGWGRCPVCSNKFKYVETDYRGRRGYIHKHLKGATKTIKGYSFERIENKNLEIDFEL